MRRSRTKPTAGFATAFMVAVLLTPIAATAPVAGQETVQPFVLEMPEGGGILELRDADEPHIIETPTTVSGSIDTETGEISDGSFATPTFAFETDGPAGISVFVEATFSDADPASGTVTPEGDVTFNASMTVGLAIGLTDPPDNWHCEATPVVLTLQSSEPYDPDTGLVTLSDPNFTVPGVPATADCPDEISSEVNEAVAGDGHFIALTLQGDLELPASIGEPSVTTLAVSPEGSSALGQPVTMTATVLRGEGVEAEEDPTGTVQFRDGANVLGTVGLSPEGVAEFTTSTLALGERALNARYSGDVVYASSSSENVPHTVTAVPFVAADLPDHVVLGADPVEFDLSVIHTSFGADIENARVDFTIRRLENTCLFNATRVTLDRHDGEDWQPVPLANAGTRTVAGPIGPETGFFLPAGSETIQRLRLGFPDVGTFNPNRCTNAADATWPGPFEVTFDVRAVDPDDGSTVADLSRSQGVVTLREPERRETNPTLHGSFGPHSLRQGMSMNAWVNLATPRSGFGAEGTLRYFLDDEPLVVRSMTDAVNVGYDTAFHLDTPTVPTAEVLIPPGTPTGARELTIVYEGNEHWKPSEITTEITVFPARGTIYECGKRDILALGSTRFGADVVALADVRRSVVPAGGQLELNEFTPLEIVLSDSRAVNGIGFDHSVEVDIDPNTGFPMPEGTIVPVTDFDGSNVHGITFGFGPSGSGTAAALSRLNREALPATPFPADEADIDRIINFHDAAGMVGLEGSPGEVIPITLDTLVIDTNTSTVDFFLGFQVAQINCVPVGDPAILAEVTLAGTTLEASSASVVAGNAVTLTATAVPASAGLMLFMNGDEAIGLVPVDGDGVASMTTSDLEVGTHSITARFFPSSFSVPSTTSEPVEIEVLPLSFTARYSEERCDTLAAVAAHFGLDSSAEILRFGVNLLRSLAESGNAFELENPPINEGPCEIEVVWPAEEADAIAAAAAAWGMDEDQLHNAGGQLVLIIIYILSVQGGGA